MVLGIAYDLHNPGRDYNDVIAAIKTARSYTHPQGSLWLVDTDIEPADWRDKLKAAGDPNDEYFIFRLAKHWASLNIDSDAATWLKSASRTW